MEAALQSGPFSGIVFVPFCGPFCLSSFVLSFLVCLCLLGEVSGGWLIFILLSPSVLGCTSINCNMVLIEAQGRFKSPCYPQKYPNSQTCRWTMQAPTGFIIQLLFLDFELEEAPGCKYDWVMVNAGNTETRFCGLTANGMTLNSSGNVMELSFTSDFSIQKKGFSVSYQHGTFRSPIWFWSSKLIQSFSWL